MLLPNDFAQGRVGALAIACVILQCWLFVIMRKGIHPDAGYLGLSMRETLIDTGSWCNYSWCNLQVAIASVDSKPRQVSKIQNYAVLIQLGQPMPGTNRWKKQVSAQGRGTTSAGAVCN